MGECRMTHVWLTILHGQICQLRNETSDRCEIVQLPGRNRGVPHLQFEIRDDRAEIGIAASLAVAVDRTLDVSHTLLYSSQCVRDRDIGVVVRVDAESAVEALANHADDLRKLVGESAAVRVAEA